MPYAANRSFYDKDKIPEGWVHVPGKWLGNTCKRLGIQYASVVVGFRNSHEHYWISPIVDGVAIQAKDELTLRNAIETKEKNRTPKEVIKQRMDLRRLVKAEVSKALKALKVAP